MPNYLTMQSLQSDMPLIRTCSNVLFFCLFFFLSVSQQGKKLRKKGKDSSAFVMLEKAQIWWATLCVCPFSQRLCHMKRREREVVCVSMGGIQECLGCLRAIRATSNLSWPLPTAEQPVNKDQTWFMLNLLIKTGRGTSELKQKVLLFAWQRRKIVWN